ncbi:uncharacterized protein LOC130629837 [Hydractinia symbiolongicarpus]|uniref:uncharacterized protein LOC130629837 n=1 Tax=Hydractinia symbiolongicarpus TaxID=13093 RepID=UPI00254AC1AF|nr:uncharacterized protein LOC130629837 [Hydractinia symbiolongicarpus]
MMYISLILVVINVLLSVAALDAPSQFKNEEQHQTSLTFTWKPPYKGGLKNKTSFSIDNNTLLSIDNTLLSIDKYYIECARRNDREIVVAEFSGSTTRGTVDGLAVYSIYSCKIQATLGGSWSRVIHYSKNIKRRLDMAKNNLNTIRQSIAPCMQPLGMENSIIPDNRLTLSNFSFIGMKISNARLNSPSMWCSRYAYVQIDLGRIMTITGLVIQGDTQGVANVNIKYGITDPNDYHMLISYQK